MTNKGTRMSTAQLVVQHLPYLRRYARALTGSQMAGDAYVAATLETLVSEPETIAAATSRWSCSRSSPASGTRSSSPTAASRSSGTCRRRSASARSRRCRARPSCSPAWKASRKRTPGQILGVDVDQVRELVDEAGRELAADMATDILIIEDEPLIAMDLEALVEGLGHNVTGVARTRTEAVKTAASKRPGLILADIQLADGSSGLDAVNDLLKTFEVPVIFITAYPERFLTGERPEPAFLIAKPFQPANVSAVISQALFFQQSARRREQPAA